MAVLIDKNTRLIVQGLTGREGTFHAKQAAAYHTNVVGGCFSPTVLLARDGSERLVFSAYYKRRFTIYVNDSKKPFQKLAELNPAPPPAGPTTIPPFQP